MNAIALIDEELALAETQADDKSYEVVHGELVEIPPMSAYASVVASRLGFELELICRRARLGRAVVEALFHLPLEEDRGRNRKPDVAFISAERWPIGKPLSRRGNAWDVVPDLAVEVLSPTDLAEEILGKVGEYFRAGVRLVWVVSPTHSVVHVWESPTSVRVLGATDALDGGAVVPGFALPLSRLFDEPEAAAPEPRADDA